MSATTEAQKPAKKETWEEQRAKLIAKLEDIEEENLVPGLKGLANLITKYSKRSIHAMAAMSQSGKTTLALDLAYEFSHKTGHNVVLYDTEGGLEDFVEQWDATMRKKYPNAKKIFVRVKRFWLDIMLDHGYDIKYKVSDNGRYGVSAIKQEKTPIEEFVLLNDVRFIVYDSITMPMKIFGAGQENFPARNTVQSLWFTTMISLIDNCKCIVWTNHHTSKNPADQYDPEKMSGGSAVHYHCKIILLMKKVDAKGARNYRRVRLVRHPRIKNFVNQNVPECILKMTDDGYFDGDDQSMEQDKKKYG